VPRDPFVLGTTAAEARPAHSKASRSASVGATLRESCAGTDPARPSGRFDFSQARFRETEEEAEATMNGPNGVERRAGEAAAWLDGLSDEDLMFVKRFLLASGSLKELAAAYGISYPTVRLRLDRLIQKIELLEGARAASAFERRLRALYADGRIDLDALRLLLAAHEQELGGRA
jgi:hypothetical protein